MTSYHGIALSTHLKPIGLGEGINRILAQKTKNDIDLKVEFFPKK